MGRPPLLTGEAFATSLYWRFIRINSYGRAHTSEYAQKLVTRLCGPPVWIWYDDRSIDTPFALGKQLPWTALEIDSLDRALKSLDMTYEWANQNVQPNFKNPSGRLLPKRLPSEKGQTRLKRLIEKQEHKGTTLIRVDRKDREGLEKYKPWKTAFAESV